ncbi:MAG: xanthine dehydrogenase family protein molybdopterin-binding subunit [Beijerinckiaceae bacterium]|nr:xanthine dehydrogenase family protein molybdopterin-binding subunit [Beijerinckiaceae bacterium]
MNVRVDDENLATMKFAVGQPVRRAEDPRLLRGEGQYTDDINRPGQAWCAMVRSPVAHGVIRGIDATAALAMPGVLAVYTAADLAAAGCKPMPYRVALKGRNGSDIIKPKRFALAHDKVRFVGDPVACVIAQTAAQAQDAAEAVGLEIEALPAVVEMADAVNPASPQLYDEAPGNVAFDYHFGDSEQVASAFKAAAHVAKLHIVDTRIVINAMEPRAAVAEFDAAEGRFTLWAPTQGVMGSRANAAEMMNVPADRMRFIATNVGGSFGMKGAIFPEYICVMHAARTLGRPVKWTDKRSDSFLSDHHGRAQEFDCELALDKDGHFLAVRCTGFGDLGAYMTQIGPLFSTFNIVKHVNSCYRTPLIEVSTRCVFTNTVPVTAYRGAGRPEGNYYMERLIDTAAAQMGVDPVELRRRNHIQPDQIPYKAPSGSVYDSGNFPAILDKALDASDWKGFAARKAESARRGRLRGRGVGQFLEVTAPVQAEYGGIHFEADGSVTILTGSHDHGQGHWTTFAQIVATQLGVPFEKIRLMQTDSDRLKTGTGTGGSKSLMCSGTAFVEAGAKVIEKGKAIASHMLEASVADIAFDSGRFAIAGTDRSISIMDMAGRLARGEKPGADAPDSLDVDHVGENGPATYPNGCHVCEVEIDPDTGVVEVVKYTMVGDFGTVVNPLIVEGQVQGGVVQGIGQCLMESTHYTPEGQLVTGSFMDYAMPRALDAPMFAYGALSDPAKTNPLGAKGCGEAGCAGSMTSVMNAVVDALSVYGVRHIDMPASPRRVWEAIRDASRQAAE